MIGLYIHVPFCNGKCPYCDFYSVAGDDSVKEAYTQVLENQLAFWAEKLAQEGTPPKADTLYFGGGTPNLLGASRLARLIRKARECFGLEKAEITLEVNPASQLDDFFREVFQAGANRVSIGLQSTHNTELKALGRRHTAEQALATIDAARWAGFSNLSLDLMLATPGQTTGSALASAALCAELGVPHVSAYLLKVEPGTPFWERRAALTLPNEDETARRYLTVGASLENAGLKQYEISNFAWPGYESRHNLKYWHCEEYLGLGPGAHSYLNGKRFYYSRDLSAFLQAPTPVADGEGGTLEETILLGLRLREGITRYGLEKAFGKEGRAAFQAMEKKGRLYQSAGLLETDGNRMALTPQGFLVSNSLIAELLPDEGL